MVLLGTCCSAEGIESGFFADVVLLGKSCSVEGMETGFGLDGIKSWGEIRSIDQATRARCVCAVDMASDTASALNILCTKCAVSRSVFDTADRGRYIGQVSLEIVYFHYKP